jgi:iron-sulfur cluster assembly accessory protein
MAVTMTSQAIAKVKEIMASQDPVPYAVRLGVRGGGCSGFQYSMQFETEKGPMDKEYEYEGLKVLVDGVSKMYLDGCEVDYLETLEAAGFKFNNPNVKSTCGCGQSFQT